MKNKNWRSALVMIASVIVFATALVYEVWRREFAVLGYFVLVVLSPMFVLLISDFMENRKGHLSGR